jgi:hypothetical protein
MNSPILAAIDAEIAKLQAARALLMKTKDVLPSLPKRGRGRPKGSTSKKAAAPAPKTRTMSPEGRARIAAAQKARWAAQKKAAKSAS